MGDLKDFELEKLARDTSVKLGIQHEAGILKGAGDHFIEALEKFKIKEMVIQCRGYEISVKKNEE